MQRTQASDTVCGVRVADRARHGRGRRERWHRVRFTARARWRGGCARSTGRARRSVRSISGRSRCAPRSAPASIAPSPSCSGGDPNLPFFTTTNTRRSSDRPSIRPRSASRGAKVWAEIWDVIGPMLSQVMSTAEPTRSRDLLLLIDRGYLEETYFSFSYSPIHGEDGAVGRRLLPGHRNHGESDRRAPAAHAARPGGAHQRARRPRTTPTPRRRRHWPRTRTTSRSHCSTGWTMQGTVAAPHGRDRHRSPARPRVARTGDARRRRRPVADGERRRLGTSVRC